MISFSPYNLIATSYSDADSYEAALSALDCGPCSVFVRDRHAFAASLLHVRLGDVSVATLGRPSLPLVVRAHRPPVVWITLRDGDPTGRPAGRSGPALGEITLCTPGMEQFVAVSPDVGRLLIGIRPTYLAERFRMLTGREIDLSPSVPLTLAPMPADLAALLTLHANATALAAGQRDDPRSEPAQIAERLVACVVACAAHGREVNDDPLTRRRHSLLLGKLREHVETHPAEALHVRDICAILAVSVRTLHAICNWRFGMGPKRYLTLRRLDMARAALRAATPNSVSVTDVALRYGFSELGRFAGAYRAHFGQTPSDTLRAP